MMQCIMKGIGFQEGFAQFKLYLQYMMKKCCNCSRKPGPTLVNFNLLQHKHHFGEMAI